MQLASRSLAVAAIASGKRAQLFASYGGMMRGGNSEAFFVIADEEITAPPMFGHASAALVMHHEHAPALWPKLDDHAVVAINSSVVDATCRPDPGVTVVACPALDIATELGAPVAASLVLLGLLVAITGLVEHAALLDNTEAMLPGYRSEAAAVNRQALAAGLELASLDHPVWLEGEHR